MLLRRKLDWRHAVFLVYCILLGAVVYRHEPWFDEAQAWLLARDLNPFDLYFTYLRYEGSPGLWHTILMIPSKLGLPYFTLNIISVLIAAAGVYIFIFYSPFPAIVKLMYPFSFFIFYQYAVVARSYVLLPLLLSIIAVAYEKRLLKPFYYIILLVLLSNVSLHGFIISIALISLYIIDILKIWINLRKPSKLIYAFGMILYIEAALLLVLQLKPPPDLISFAAFNRDLSQFYPRTINMLSDSMLTNLSLGRPADRIYHLFTHGLFTFTLVISLYWFILRKKLLTFILPTVGLGLLFTVIYSNLWHQGSLFLVWIFVLWISIEGNVESKKSFIVPKTIILTLTVIILIFQVAWSFNSFKYDITHNYSASADVAGYIKENSLQNKRIYMTSFHTVSILLYFSENVFCNYHNSQKPSFWIWSGENNLYTEPYLNLSKYQPDIIIMGVKKYSDKFVKLDNSMLPSIPDYKVTKYFNGSIYWKDQPYETDSFVLYEKIK